MHEKGIILEAIYDLRTRLDQDSASRCALHKDHADSLERTRASQGYRITEINFNQPGSQRNENKAIELQAEETF